MHAQTERGYAFFNVERIMNLFLIGALTACLKHPTKLESELRKSPNDHRSYRALVLDNGMYRYFRSETECRQHSAFMSVSFISINRQGLAHSLEHMLFLGSKKYTVGDYRKFIMGNGGRSNAGTGQENTTYHFEITPDIDEGLDFSQFFTSPSFSRLCQESEKPSILNTV